MRGPAGSESLFHVQRLCRRARDRPYAAFRQGRCRGGLRRRFRPPDGGVGRRRGCGPGRATGHGRFESQYGCGRGRLSAERAAARGVRGSGRIARDAPAVQSANEERLQFRAGHHGVDLHRHLRDHDLRVDRAREGDRHDGSAARLARAADPEGPSGRGRSGSSSPR